MRERLACPSVPSTAPPISEVADLIHRAASAPAEPPADLSETVRAAAAANAAGDFTAACALFDEAFARSGRLQHLLSAANMRLKLGRPEQAAHAYEHVLSTKGAKSEHAEYAMRRLREEVAAAAGLSIGSASIPATPRMLNASPQEVDHMAAENPSGSQAADASAITSDPGREGAAAAADGAAETRLEGQLVRLQTLLRCEQQLRVALRARLAAHAEAEAALRDQLAEARAAPTPAPPLEAGRNGNGGGQGGEVDGGAMAARGVEEDERRKLAAQLAAQAELLRAQEARLDAEVEQRRAATEHAARLQAQLGRHLALAAAERRERRATEASRAADAHAAAAAAAAAGEAGEAGVGGEAGGGGDSDDAGEAALAARRAAERASEARRLREREEAGAAEAWPEIEQSLRQAAEVAARRAEAAEASADAASRARSALAAAAEGAAHERAALAARLASCEAEAAQLRAQLQHAAGDAHRARRDARDAQSESERMQRALQGAEQELATFRGLDSVT